MTGTKLQNKHVIAKDHIFSYFSASYMIVIQFRTIKPSQCLANRCITKSMANWAPIHIILSHSYWNVCLIHPGPFGEITLTDYIIRVRSEWRDSFSNEPWLELSGILYYANQVFFWIIECIGYIRVPGEVHMNCPNRSTGCYEYNQATVKGSPIGSPTPFPLLERLDFHQSFLLLKKPA